MAAINRSVALNVIANIDGFQREYSKLPGITEKQATAAALKMVNAFSKAEAKIAIDSAKAAQRATRTITTSTTQATRAMAAAGTQSAATMTRATQAVAIQIPDVISQLSMGANPLQVLIQQGLQPVQQFLPQIMSGFSAIFAVLGPVTLAAVSAAGAFLAYKNAAEEAAEANGRLTARVDEATSAHKRAQIAVDGHRRAQIALSASIRDAERDTAVILGEISKEEVDRQRLTEAIERQSHAMIRDASIAVAQGERRQQAIRNELGDATISTERRIDLTKQLATVAQELDRDRARLFAAQQRRDEAIEAGQNRLFEQISAEREKEAAKVAETERRKREALRKTRDEERRAAEERAAREAEAATDALAGLESQLARDQAGALDLVNMKYDERLAKLREIEETLGTSQRTIALGFDIEEQRIAEIEALRDETRAKRMAQIEADAAEEVAIRQRSADAIRAATMGLISTTSAAFMQAAQRQVETNREGAMRSFRISKALNIAEAVMNTQAAASRALKDYVFPASAVVAGLVAATGAIRVGMIASQQPSFDVGGVVGGGIVGAPLPDQQPARLLAGEAVLNRTATASLGAEGVRALNRGEDIAPRVVVVDAFRHFDRFMGDELGRGGRLTRALDGQREYPIGQRGY